jgi:hypothetical protein
MKPKVTIMRKRKPIVRILADPFGVFEITVNCPADQLGKGQRLAAALTPAIGMIERAISQSLQTDAGGRALNFRQLVTATRTNFISTASNRMDDVDVSGKKRRPDVRGRQRG